jgi:protoheme IX farnesyltransferase
MRALCALTKPRVVSLIVFTAVTGMFLATPGMVPVQILLAATLGIASVAGAAAAVNCLVEQKIDAVMQRTRARPLPRGELSSLQTLLFAGMLGGLGLWLLVHFVNPLTMWLTLATFVGYAIVYTLILKPMTPQNIVIGGASGAMPPVLGWTEEYAKAGLPMLPVTHGRRYTQLQVLLYSLILFGVSLLPFAIRMSGWLYIAAACVLGAIFIGYAIALYARYSDRLAQRAFRYSIVYLAALFAALLVDHYLA